MADVVPLIDPKDYARVHARIRRLWDKGSTQIIGHAAKRMRERDIDIGDVRQVIRCGVVVEHSQPKDLWRYVIEGRTSDGDRLRVVVEVNGHLLVVTVVDLD